MIHRTFESIEAAVIDALEGDAEFAPIAKRIRDHAVLLALGGDQDAPQVLRAPDVKDGDTVVMLLLDDDRDVPNGSIVFIETIVSRDRDEFSALFLLQKECHPFWFGLKLVHDWLIFERARDYANLKLQVVEATREMLESKATRRQSADFRRESHVRLRAHAEETRLARERLCFRAINRQVGGALERWRQPASQIVLREQNALLREIASEIHESVLATHPDALSYEESAARSVLIACATSYLASRSRVPKRAALC